MYSVRPLPEFTEWLNALQDETVRGILIARIRRLQDGLLGDVASVGDGVSELRVHVGAGWRVYFTKRGKVVVVLVGGSKRTQTKDILRAKALAAVLD